MFSDSFKITKICNKISVFEKTEYDNKNIVLAGTYNNGLISVLDAELAGKLLSQWNWLLKEQFIPLILTGFGDVFLYDKNAKSIHFLEVQRGLIEYVDSEITWFMDEFLDTPEVVNDVLKKSKYDELAISKRSLDYLEAFILEPWLMLGGKDELSKYSIGSCAVYLDLVGQTLKP